MVATCSSVVKTISCEEWKNKGFLVNNEEMNIYGICKDQIEIENIELL